MPLTQKSRLLAIETALGPDVVVLRSLAVQEQISRPFQIETELLSEDGSIKFDDIVGRNATVRMQMSDKDTRYFNGFVSRFVQVANQGAHARYRATLVPWLWFLTRTSDCRIFMDKKVPEIIEEVFKGHGFSDYQLKLSGTYEKLEYCAQYRETDFNFVSRLMEQAGIFYFFKHENGKHTLVLADSASAHDPAPGYEDVIFSILEKGAAGRQIITEWSVEKEVQTGAYALNDFDFTKPKASLRSVKSVNRDYGAAQFEMYDYPGEFLVVGEGSRLAQVRLDELQAQHDVRHGKATARGLSAGHIFNLKHHPRADQNKSYLITGVTLNADAGDYGSAGGSGEFFSCTFTAIEKAQQYRPIRLATKPVVHGVQTAIVVGPSGEEIYTDKYGRVKVQFHWDRYGKANENSSCWIRVSQGWAGKQWGSIYLPRIGQEVIVDFLEGDPDRPLITGRVYNGEAMPPYELPGEKTKSTLKSNSSKGGAGFNEIRFEDKKGSEQIFIHGEKDEDIYIKHDAREWIGNDRHLEVVQDQVEHVKRDRNEKVDRDHVEEIGRDFSLKITGKDSVEVGGQLSVKVKKDVAEEFGANHYEETKKQYYLSAKEIVIEAGDHITIQVGTSFIAIDKQGITISTKGKFNIESVGNSEIEAKASIKLKCSAPMSLESDATADLKSAKTSVKGSGMVEIQGGMVKIN